MSQPRDPHEPFVRHGDQLETFLQNFWQRQVDAAENDPPPYGRHPPLPLARIKKVMKSDPDVRMIASDAPVLFCKACEIFIQEITCRAFLVADAHKRRTISKSDIAKALAKSDHFDFLIDVVPRDEAERAKTQKALVGAMENALAEQTKVEGGMVPGTSGHGQISPTTQQQHSPLGPPLMYQHPSGHLAMAPHMQGTPIQQGPLTHQGRAPAPLNLSMPPHRTHSQSQSQSQPPPLIPNLRSPTGNGHAHQAPSNQRRQSVTGMSLSPTIPLSSSRMDPPSSLDISR